jgi:hypothetical protein
MKETALSLAILGVLGILMAAFTALEVAPTFVGEEMAVGAVAATAAFWGGLAALVLLAAIAFGIISGGGGEF